jgi:tetratricopeptide (TPR) repeat protein
MSDYPGQATINAARKGVLDTSPLVRRAAADALRDADPRVSGAVLAPLLRDKIRAVRLEAAEVLAGAPAADLSDSGVPALDSAITEYVEAQNLNADRPESHLNLASVFARENRFNDARAELQLALRLDPSFTPAAVNLADLDRQRGDDAKGERVLRIALGRSPKDPSLQHALGLLLVRQGHRDEALEHLADAQRLDPANARFAFVYALALADDGQIAQAIKVLEVSLARHPYDRDSLAALANFYRAAGDSAGAASCARRLANLSPDR